MLHNHSSLDLFRDTSDLSQHQNKTKKATCTEIYPKKWTVSQNILYARYLKTHMSQTNNYKKKRRRTFVKMANFIGSKNFNQCKSHHQKMMLTFNSIQNIIIYASDLKRGRQVLKVDKLDKKNNKKEVIRHEKQKIYKIEQQTKIEKQSEQTLNKGKNCLIKIGGSFKRDFAISQKKSQFEGNSNALDNIFNVLDIDQALKQSQYFSI